VGLGIVMFAVWVYCLLDVIMADEHRIRNLSKGTWIMIVLLTFEVGAIAWLVAGRPQSAPRGLPYKGMDSNAWEARVLEATAHLERAHGDGASADRLLERAAALFVAADQPLDARRCVEDRPPLTSALAWSLVPRIPGLWFPQSLVSGFPNP